MKPPLDLVQTPELHATERHTQHARNYNSAKCAQHKSQKHFCARIFAVSKTLGFVPNLINSLPDDGNKTSHRNVGRSELIRLVALEGFYHSNSQWKSYTKHSCYTHTAGPHTCTPSCHPSSQTNQCAAQSKATLHDTGPRSL